MKPHQRYRQRSTGSTFVLLHVDGKDRNKWHAWHEQEGRAVTIYPKAPRLELGDFTLIAEQVSVQTWTWSPHSDLYPVRFVDQYTRYWLRRGQCRLDRYRENVKPR